MDIIFQLFQTSFSNRRTATPITITYCFVTQFTFFSPSKIKGKNERKNGKVQTFVWETFSVWEWLLAIRASEMVWRRRTLEAIHLGSKITLSAL